MTETLFKSFARSHGRLGALVAPLLLITAAPAPAFAEDVFYLGTYRATRPTAVENQRVHRVRKSRSVVSKSDEKAEKVAAEGAKPRGPLVIAISIQQQRVKVYDSNGLFAESPISSGMAGHATPMGVFSVIQKHKHHRSNIYSGAPMPYMQRITWSGVAMHAGVLPGYPASHGCIRMPMSFAMKMWGWTRMGARVIVAPGEVSPADFTHPTLAGLVAPQPLAALPDAPAMPRIKTADASAATNGRADPLVMVDIATSGVAVAPKVSDDPAQVAAAAGAKAASEQKVLDAKDEMPAAIDGMPPVPAPAPIDFSDVAPIRSGDDAAPLTAQAPAGATETNSDTSVNAAAHADAAALPPPVTSLSPEQAAQVKDQTQFGSSVAETTAATPLIKRNLPVAIFVSRKDGKLYVRQDFKPLLDVPVQISDGSKALGTHVFTARKDDSDDKKLQWSVVSLPATARQTSVHDDERGSRRRRTSQAEPVVVEVGSAQEALERIAMPSDLMTRLGDALPPGSSLVVSDQGIAQGETGAGTDFIVRLR